MKFRIHQDPITDEPAADAGRLWEPSDADLDCFDELRAEMLDICQAALDARFIELRDEAMSEVSALERQAYLALAEQPAAPPETDEPPLTHAEMEQFGRTLVESYQKAMVADLVGPLVEAARLAAREGNEPFVRLDQNLVPYETRYGAWLEEELHHVGLRYDLPSQRLKEFAGIFARRIVPDRRPVRFPGGTMLTQSPRFTFDTPRYRAATEARWREAAQQQQEIIDRYGPLQKFYADWIERLRRTALEHNQRRVVLGSGLEPVAPDLRPEGDMARVVAHARAASSFLFDGVVDEVEDHAQFAPYAGVVFGVAEGDTAKDERYYVQFTDEDKPVQAESIDQDFAQAIDISSAALKASG